MNIFKMHFFQSMSLHAFHLEILNLYINDTLYTHGYYYLSARQCYMFS